MSLNFFIFAVEFFQETWCTSLHLWSWLPVFLYLFIFQDLPSVCGVGAHSFYEASIVVILTAAAAAKSLQSRPTLCDPINGSPQVSPIPRILQARTLEWVAISFSNAWKWKVKVKSLSRAQLLATPWTAAYQAPPSMGFSRQEYWSGLSLPSLVVILRSLSKRLGFFWQVFICKKVILWKERERGLNTNSFALDYILLGFFPRFCVAFVHFLGSEISFHSLSKLIC